MRTRFHFSFLLFAFCFSGLAQFNFRDITFPAPVTSGGGGGGGCTTTPAFVQSTNNNTATVTSVAQKFDVNVTAGNAIIVITTLSASGRTLTVTDSAGDTFVKATNQVQTTEGSEIFIYYALNVAGGATTVTNACSGAATSFRVAQHEYSNIALTSALDGASGNQADSSTAPDSGTFTTTCAHSLIVCGVRVDSSISTPTPGTSFTSREAVPATPNVRLASEERVLTTTGTYSGSFTLSASRNWCCVAAAFKSK